MPKPGRHPARSGVRCWLALGVLALSAFAAAATGRPAQAPGSTGGAAASSNPTLLRATVDHRARRLPTARHFIGLSLEYPYITALGNSSTRGNPVLARLFQNITDAGNGTPVLRLGGGTQDQAWWNPDGKPRPTGISHDITPATVDALKGFLAQAHLPLIVGLNMAGNHPGYAVGWARAALNGLGRNAITAFEVGNEPDLYPVRGYGGQPQPRPDDWGFADYLDEFEVFSSRLKQLRRWLPLAGPGACCDRVWDRRLPKMLDRFGSRLSLVTTHHYLLCTMQDVSLNDVLSDRLIIEGNARLDPVAAAARAGDKRLRLTETAINGCRGDARLGYALWATDWLMNLSRRFVGADFHLIGQSPFGMAYRDVPLDPHWEGTVTPLYYAMLLAARAIRSGSSVLPDATFGARRENGSNTRIWATIDRKRAIRVVAINKGEDSGKFVLRVPGAHRPAEVQRLVGDDVSSSEGVTLAGQAVAKSSRTGRLQGAKVIAHVQPTGVVYRVPMPAYSAALVTIRDVG